ncbi:MAG: hypothetical protein SNJ64_01845 [Endomicrobiia bacterium]
MLCLVLGDNITNTSQIKDCSVLLKFYDEVWIPESPFAQLAKAFCLENQIPYKVEQQRDLGISTIFSTIVSAISRCKTVLFIGKKFDTEVLNFIKDKNEFIVQWYEI